MANIPLEIIPDTRETVWRHEDEGAGLPAWTWKALHLKVLDNFVEIPYQFFTAKFQAFFSQIKIKYLPVL